MPATFWLLLKKNFQVELKSWKWFIIETLIVLTFSGIILGNPAGRRYNHYRYLEMTATDDYHIGTGSMYSISTLLELLGVKPDRVRYKLTYTPRNNFTTKIVEATKRALQLRDIEGLDNADELNSYISENEVLAGIEFHNVSDDTVPEKFSVTLRFPSKFRTIQDYGVNMRNQLWVTRCSGILTQDDSSKFRAVDIYAREGFLQLQHRLFIEWVKLLKEKDGNGTVKERRLRRHNEHYSHIQKMKKIRKTEHVLKSSANLFGKKKNFDSIISYADSKESRNEVSADPADIPIIQLSAMRPSAAKSICYSEENLKFNWFLWHFFFFLTFINIIWRLSRENEKNIIVHHYIYGYEALEHFLAHFIVFFFHLMIMAVFIIIIMMVEWSNDPDLYIFRKLTIGTAVTFFVLFSITLILYATLISQLFSNAVNATLCGATMWMAAYGLFSVVFFETSDLKPIALFSLALFCNNFFPTGMRVMKNLDKSPNFTPIHNIMITQAVTIGCLVFLIILTNHFKPGRHMTISNFFYSLLCIRKPLKPNKKGQVFTMSASSREYIKKFEDGPALGKEVLNLRNISTFYSDRGVLKPKLRNITMRIYEGEITVILGGHDNGKANLISLLAGWCKPKIGEIYYNNNDIYKTWKEYRHQMDVCMTYNALFDMFSVWHTLRYFGLIKQRQKNIEELNKEVEKWVKILASASIKRDELVQDLTYGQKHLLALSCAMMCNTHLILLHEPTLFIGEEHQRFYWRMLVEEKANRVIVVTTISIDEAEEIGDRVGILNQGILVAYGSPYYLKQIFTIGFDLIIMKQPSSDVEAINKIITSLIPEAQLSNQIDRELLYKLPREKKHLFQHLLLKLEYAKESLGLSSVRLFSSELGEVYMKTTTNKRSKLLVQDISQTLTSLNEEPRDLKRRQLAAMFFKKMIVQAPNVVPIAMMFLVFILIFLINALVSVIQKPYLDQLVYTGYKMEQQTRDLKQYTQNCTYYEITDIKEDNKIEKYHSRGYVITNIKCGHNDYKVHYRNESRSHVVFGCVEKRKNSRLRVWSNDALFHTAPLTLNLAHNLILEELFPDKPSRLTTIVNKPLPVPLHAQITLSNNHVSQLRVPLIFGTIMPITMACFVIPVIEERHNHLMSLQRIAGIDIHIFWISGILWDICTFFCFSLLYMLAALITKIEGFTNVSKLLTLLLLNVHGVAVISMMYVLAFFMNKSKTRAFFQAALLQYITGLCAYVFYWDVVEAHNVFFTIASFSPSFSLLEAITRLYILSAETDYCKQRCKELIHCNKKSMCAILPSCCRINYWIIEPPGLLSCLLLMIGSTLIFGSLFFLHYVYHTEKKYKLPLHLKKKGIKVMRYPYDDNDVVKEKVRIAEMPLYECRKYNVLADQLENYIPKHGKRLNAVSFALDKSMCMGIYGAHKSGKSHLIYQLVGIYGFRFGELYVEGKDFKYNNRDALKTIGFCAENNDLCGTITPRQLFKLLLMIRGVPNDEIHARVKELCIAFDLRLVMNTRITYLSRAMQRRISVATSLVIYNGVLILDEPCRGMPGLECSFIANVLKYARSCGKTIILSSYCSTECQTTTDFITVIQDGEMLAMGSPQYLRHKYTKGVYLMIKLRLDGSTIEEAVENLERDVDNVMSFVAFLHEDSYLVTQKNNFLVIYLPVEEITFSYLYGSMEKNYRRLNILSYSVNQGSLVYALEKILATRILREPFRKSKRKRQLPRQISDA